MDPEVGSVLEYKYSVTCVASKVDWYRLCVIWSKGGAIARSGVGRIILVVVGVYGRGFVGCEFVKGV